MDGNSRLVICNARVASVVWCGAYGSPAFIEVDAPTDDELHALLQTAIARLMKMLTRRGVLVEDMGQTWLAAPDADGEEGHIREWWKSRAECSEP
ncbi:hypothetical protein [Pseudaquabacterium rugosum]|uniref:DUF1902 domain-containing protein n=1 Tax=Pseudaquabacterium rugosum TaxID=2984194 RepID=A0ABU9BEJ0_9BURK